MKYITSVYDITKCTPGMYVLFASYVETCGYKNANQPLSHWSFILYHTSKYNMRECTLAITDKFFSK